MVKKSLNYITLATLLSVGLAGQSSAAALPGRVPSDDARPANLDRRARTPALRAESVERLIHAVVPERVRDLDVTIVRDGRVVFRGSFQHVLDLRSPEILEAFRARPDQQPTITCIRMRARGGLDDDGGVLHDLDEAECDLR